MTYQGLCLTGNSLPHSPTYISTRFLNFRRMRVCRQIDPGSSVIGKSRRPRFARNGEQFGGNRHAAVVCDSGLAGSCRIVCVCGRRRRRPADATTQNDAGRRRASASRILTYVIDYVTTDVRRRTDDVVLRSLVIIDLLSVAARARRAFALRVATVYAVTSRSSG